MDRKRYVIIGNGAAAVRAAETLRRLDADGTITMISGEVGAAYSRCLLPAFLAGKKDEEGLRIRTGDFYERHRIETRFGNGAVGIEPAERQVVLEDGRRIGYDKLLIATGSSTALPPVRGLHGHRLYGLRNLSDARRILRAAAPGRRAVILGAGLVGLEAAVALVKRGLEVTLVEKLPHLLPRQLDATAAEILRRDLDHERLRVITGTGVREACAPEPSKAAEAWELLLDSGERLRADVVVAATGIKPNVEFLGGSGICIDKGIPVDDYMETSVPGIYAAGDVAETRDAVTGLRMLTPTWPHASLQGAIAAWNMAGRPRGYPQEVGIQNAVQLNRVPAVTLGIGNPEDPSYEVAAVHRPADNLYRKLVLKDGIPVGAILVGEIKGAGILAALMRRRVRVSGCKDFILNGEFYRLCPVPAC